MPFDYRLFVFILFDSDEEEKNAKTRRVVRANNFTQQTNALDVDKHMCVQDSRI